MKGIITTIKSQFRLFRQPHKIGDVIDVNDISYLILGIQRFQLYGHRLTIWYTTQNLTEDEYVSKKKAYKEAFTLEAEVKFKHDDHHKLERIQLGTIHNMDGQTYQLMEYTELRLDGTDLYVSFIVKPIHPIDRKEARAKYFNERRKKLSFEVIG